MSSRKYRVHLNLTKKEAEAIRNVFFLAIPLTGAKAVQTKSIVRKIDAELESLKKQKEEI